MKIRSQRDKERAIGAIGQRIRARRTKLGISQRDLAKDLDVDQAHLWKWEAGRRRPSLENLAELCTRLAMTLDYLVLGVRPRRAAPENDNARARAGAVC
jgi:transcriptional regulator with XRE-family HTH domain